MNRGREWMYRRSLGGSLNPKFLAGIESFISFAITQPDFMDGDNIKCPCAKCDNIPYEEVDVVRYHLAQHGFVKNYEVWEFHGETPVTPVEHDDQSDTDEIQPTYHEMVMDHARSQFYEEEAPNPNAQGLYDMLNAADRELWDGCKKHSQLSLVSRLMTLKAENNMSVRCFDQVTELMKEIVPEENLIPNNFYDTKRLLRDLGLPVEKIDCCPHNCMIYWGDDIHLTQCKFCNTPRYKDRSRGGDSKRHKPVAAKKMYYFPLTPRLQRLYASKVTAENMRWHSSSPNDGIMRHPADTPAWKHLNDCFPDFAAEPRNVRLGLSTDGFQPFGQSGQQYSSWPVILTPYNLPPWMCMKEQFMFLTVLVPGPQSPKDKLDVFLQPLISELKNLWEVGEITYDVSLKQNFQMRAALLWTVSDFPAYSMLSGWSTAGKLACPYCMEETDAFTLQKSGKQSWFDNHRKFLPADHEYRRNKKDFIKGKQVLTTHPPERRSGEELLSEIEQLGFVKVTEEDADEVNRVLSRRYCTGWKKRSIFWDLPYWKYLLIRHNLDVMHIEKNVFDNVFNTVLNVQGKTKDTSKSREELNLYCSRPHLKRNEASGKYPKACYTLDNNAKKILCEWIKALKFPDGYVSNLGRCIDMRKLRMFGMKSHDCHVFMQLILPIAFRELLPQGVWNAITELSLFFKELTSKSIRVEDMCRLNDTIPITLCKLERIFPPSFFDSMEHLPIHLADEARMAGPVQYRWMYPFERYFRKLKNKVKNKARVEGSICNAYLVEEASTFCSYYFEEHVYTKNRTLPRNIFYEEHDHRYDGHPDRLAIFKQPGHTLGRHSDGYLTEKEYEMAHIYVLLNCPEVTESYLKIFVDGLRACDPGISDSLIDLRTEKEFASWFEAYVNHSPPGLVNDFIKALAKGPFRSIKKYSGYYVNGYKFHTMEHGTSKATMNSGVCIKGEVYGSYTDNLDYYGRLLEVCELEYQGLPKKTTMLFKCEWFDPSSMGTNVHPRFKFTSINHTRRYQKFDPFVLANQATQVVYCTYPSLNQSRKNWWEVCKIQARSTIEVPNQASSTTSDQPFQEDGLLNSITRDEDVDVDLDMTPIHSHNDLIDLDDASGDDDDGENIYLSGNESYSDDDDDEN